MVLALSLAAPIPGISAANLTKCVVSIAPGTETFEVNSYYGVLSHGPTQKFFLLPGQGVVVVRWTEHQCSEASAEIKVVPRDTSIEHLRKWLNNQHSDALYQDAARELRTINVPLQYLHSSISSPLEHEVGRDGEEYDREIGRAHV